MKKIESLKDVVEFNSSFKTAINLYLNLNRADKVLAYIPTKSSAVFLGDYLNSVLNNKEQATLLVGPYGKGKSHLILVLLAILSMERNKENNAVIKALVKKIRKIDEIGTPIGESIEQVWKKERFLPVLITDTTNDLGQAFLYGLNDALKRENLTDLVPNTFYSAALERIDDWKNNYDKTYKLFVKELKARGTNINKFTAGLKMFSKENLEIFKEIYPLITSGSDFNPMAVSDVLPLYKSVSEKLADEYQFSGIYVIFDEFSKFVESQDGQAVGANMKLLQDICELATESRDSQIFFTMIAHKSIKEYGKYLSQEIINSFTGIEGRIIEKYFITSSKNNYELIKNAIIKDEKRLSEIPHYDTYLGDDVCEEFYQLPAFKSSFPEKDFKSIIFKGCYPLNPITSYLLLNVSEKVAQNERTLFTFISNDEPHSMARFVAEHNANKEWSIGSDLVYDYFSPLFKKEVSNEYVHNIWLSAEYAIEKCETEDQKRIIKALAIILIVNKEDEIPATAKYIKLSINADDADAALQELQKKEFIYKKRATETYMFKTRAGSELKAEVRRLRELKGDNVNFSKALLDVTGKYYVIPRKYNTLNLMTRYFTNEFMDADDFLKIDSAEALLGNDILDGKVITLYSFSDIKQDSIKRHFQRLADKRIVVVCPKSGLKVQKQLKDYEIISELKNNPTFTSNNEILKKELPLLIEDLTIELENVVKSVYEEDSDTKVLYYDGKKIQKEQAWNIEQAVNDCCNCIYRESPIINNEMVNRSNIGTGQTKKARINVINALLTHTDSPDFYAGTNQEATIYRSLFSVTGITDGTPNANIATILNIINEFVDSCSDQKVLLKGLLKTLTSEPFGMRVGVIPFYLAYVLSNRREDIVVYFADKEVQMNADIIVNMSEQPEDYALFVSKADLLKEKYISSLNNLFQVEDNRNLTTNRIKNIIICMQRWFRALPQVARNTVNIDEYVMDEKTANAMREIKRALQSVEFNPFEILFVDFPKAFKTESLEETFLLIDDCKTAYDDYFRWIEDRVIEVIYNNWNNKKKQDLIYTLRDWYNKQSKRSKQGLYNGRVTNFMSCIENLDVYSNQDVADKVVKAVTDVYLENWNVGSLEEFSSEIKSIKTEIENIRDDASTGELELSFTGRNGEMISKLYSHANESTGSVLRNIIEDALDEYSDLSVNDRVSILLEMIEKIIK